MQRRGLCVKCWQVKTLTKHHIYPKRFFSGNRNKPNILYLCRECHDHLEYVLPFKRMKKGFYDSFCQSWLAGDIVNRLVVRHSIRDTIKEEGEFNGVGCA